MWADNFCVYAISGSLDLDISTATCVLYDTSSNPVPVGERMFTLDSMSSRVCIVSTTVDNKDA